ncbi:MAG TPA: hypothetical protein VNL71_12055, partial [Chloroflexota bacterium]|nr:hypothetical protein [Chloroflexota bacterium]
TGRGGHGWPACSTGQVGPAVTVPSTTPYAAGTDADVLLSEDPHPAGIVASATATPSSLACLMVIILVDVGHSGEVPGWARDDSAGPWGRCRSDSRISMADVPEGRHIFAQYVDRRMALIAGSGCLIGVQVLAINCGRADLPVCCSGSL